MLDADGHELVWGRIYRIASAPECENRFRCVAVDDPNGTMFVRLRDGMFHLGREFIEWRGETCYYDVSSDVANGKEKSDG